MALSAPRDASVLLFIPLRDPLLSHSDQGLLLLVRVVQQSVPPALLAGVPFLDLPKTVSLVAGCALTRVLDPPGVLLLLPARPAVNADPRSCPLHKVPQRVNSFALNAVVVIVDVPLSFVAKLLRCIKAVPFVVPFPLLLLGGSELFLSRHVASKKECLTSVLKRWQAQSAILFVDSKKSIL